MATIVLFLLCLEYPISVSSFLVFLMLGFLPLELIHCPDKVSTFPFSYHRVPILFTEHLRTPIYTADQVSR